VANTTTANYGWQMPDPGGSANTWGNTLNATTQAIDAQVHTNAQAGVPVGSMTMWPAAVPPANWLLCQGQSLATTGTYAALFAIIGHTYGGAGASFNLPDLRSTFPIGAGTLGGRGGSTSYPISVANLPAHAHSITDIAHNHGVNQSPHGHPDAGHGHGVNEAPHSHTVANVALGSGVNIQPGSGFNQVGTLGTSANVTGISVQTGAANIQAANANISLDASGTGLSTTNNTGSGTPLSVTPPFLALNFIIKFA
jgi:microcystin-dependent protein